MPSCGPICDRTAPPSSPARLGDDRLAIRTRTQFADTRTAWVTSAAIRSGNDLSVVLLATWEPTSPDLAVELVMAAGRKVP